MIASKNLVNIDNHPLSNRVYLMKSRCENPHNRSYRNYGARGIRYRLGATRDAVAYLESLPNADVSLDVDRIDNDGHYERGNLRFVTRQANCKNKSDNTIITLNGVTQTLGEWSDQLCINRNTLSSRINEYGWDVKDALLTPVKITERTVITFNGESNTFYAWSQKTGISRQLIRWRIRRGWPIGKALFEPANQNRSRKLTKNAD